MPRPSRMAALIACAVAVLLLAFTPADSESGGMPGRAAEGCGDAACHGVTADEAVIPLLEGVPVEYVPGETYLLNVGVEGARDPLPVTGNQGGFALRASDGALSPPPGDETVQVAEGGDATHTNAGATGRAWTVVWTAPPPTGGAVTFHLTVNAVNGNGLNDVLDQWNTITTTSREGSLPDPPPRAEPEPENTRVDVDDASTPAPGVVAAIVAALVALQMHDRGRRD